MKLVTHNLVCCLKCQHFPLDVNATVVDVAPVEFNEKFVRRLLARIQYQALASAFNSLRTSHVALQSNPPLPTVDPAQPTEDDLKKIHFAMNCVAIKNGVLSCPECTASYPINDFVANLMVE